MKTELLKIKKLVIPYMNVVRVKETLYIIIYGNMW